MRAYSLDLRKKVMMHYATSGNKVETARIFNIHKDTITNWSKKEGEGKLAANKSGPKGYKKVNPVEVCKYVEEHPDMNLHELAKIFKVSHVAIWKLLHKEGFVNKKKTTLQRKKRRAASWVLKDA